MSDAPWCDHCDLPKSTCVHGRPEKVDFPVADGPTITATQTTPTCAWPTCSNPLNEGEQITHTDEGWAHARHLGTSTEDLFEGMG